MVDYIDWGKFEEGFRGLHDSRYLEKRMAERASYKAGLPQDDYASRMQRAEGQSAFSAQGGISYSLAGGLSGRLSYSSGAVNKGLYDSLESKSNLKKECSSCGRENDGPHPKCRNCLDR